MNPVDHCHWVRDLGGHPTTGPGMVALPEVMLAAVDPHFGCN